MIVFAVERLDPRQFDVVRNPIRAGGEDKLLWPKRYDLAATVHLNSPFLGRLVIGRANAFS